MNIQSGRNPIRRTPSNKVAGSSPMSKVKPALFIIVMIIMVAGVCELHVYFKSGISSLSLEIESTRREIRNTSLELKNLRNKVEERNRWSYIRHQISRFGIKLKRPAPGQMHLVSMLPARTIHLAGEAMEKRALSRSAMVTDRSQQKQMKNIGRRNRIR